MKTLLLAIAVAAAACSSATASKDELRAQVSPAPASLSSRSWSPSIRLTRNGSPANARLALTIRQGPQRRVFVPRRTGRGAYRGRVLFPADGRWSWAVTAGRRTLARGSVSVFGGLRFELPYDLAVASDGTILFVDRGRILRIEPGNERVTVHRRTPAQEIVAMVRLADGTFFVADFPANRILRIDPAGTSSVVASVPAPADLVADPTGTTLWVASIAPGVGAVRVDVATGRVEPFARVDNSHGIDRDPDGNFYAQDGSAISRIDGRTGAVTHFANVDGIKLLVAPDRSLYSVSGNPGGGRVMRIAPDGSVTRVAGTGLLGPHRDGRALAADILPSAVAFAHDGTLLVAQTEPIPAIRRVDLAAGTISTVVRGR